MSVQSSIQSIGGIAATHELLRRGHGPDEIFGEVRAGRIIRVRKGWYVTPEVSTPIQRALRVGGRLACVSAAEHHGLWVLESDGLHVAVPRRASRLRTAEDHRERLADHPDGSIEVHWTRGEPSGNRSAVTAAECIQQIFACKGPRAGFITLESALNQRKLGSSRTIVDALSSHSRELAAIASGDSDSGTESMLKLELVRIGLTFRQQVYIAGAGLVDFLVGERLVIEVDSKAYHTDPYRDRRRDAALSARGYRVLRFMYSQIVFEWHLVEASIRAAVSRGDHLAS